jgi:hypothetical protein
MTLKMMIAEDTALKSYLQSFEVTDEKNATRTVPVWFGYPDVELRQQTFPFMTIDLIGIEPDDQRQAYGYLYDNDFAGTTTGDSITSYKYHFPVAYDLIYQVTAYSRHPRHEREITHQFLQDFPGKFGYILVSNETETDSVWRHMFLEEIKKKDTIEDGRRLFRTVFTLLIVSEMPPNYAEEISRRVEQVNINTNPTHIPTDLTPITTTIQV